jgi:hypothetical protein
MEEFKDLTIEEWNFRTIISQHLQNLLGKELSEHEEKAQFIWSSFKERLGISEFSGLNFELASFITPAEDIDWLQGEFLKE